MISGMPDSWQGKPESPHWKRNGKRNMELIGAILETAIYGGPARAFCIFLLAGWASLIAMAILPTIWKLTRPDAIRQRRMRRDIRRWIANYDRETKGGR